MFCDFLPLMFLPFFFWLSVRTWETCGFKECRVWSFYGRGFLRVNVGDGFWVVGECGEESGFWFLFFV